MIVSKPAACQGEAAPFCSLDDMWPIDKNVVPARSLQCTKVLYVSHDRGDAQRAAGALGGILPGAVVLWASRLDQAMLWIHENREVAALVIDSDVDPTSCASFLKGIRALDLTAATVVITPDGTTAPECLEAGADGHIQKNPTLLRNLPGVVNRAIQARLTSALAEAVDTRDLLDRQLNEARASLEAAERVRTSDLAAADGRLAQYQAQLDLRLAEAARMRTTFELLAGDVEAALHQREAQWEENRADLEQRLIQTETALLTSETERASATLAAADLAEHQTKSEAEWAAARNTLEVRLDDAAKAFSDLYERATRERLAATEWQADLEVRLEHEIDKRKTQEQEIAVLRQASEDVQRRFRDETAISAMARDDAARLAEQLEGTRRQFEQLPLPMFRCTRDGSVVHANRAFAALVGSHDAAEFHSPEDLAWVVDRCVNTNETVSVETTWKLKTGGRLIVRLTAMASTNDAIDIVAEDLTNLRALQNRLDQAQRMEAVGRLASEVAVTCGNLLRDVNQDGQHWLSSLDSNAAFRQRGEMLLAEVTRAASFLRQLDAYGDEQTSALEPGDLNQVLCDLGPVLKQVVGDHIEFVLPKGVSRLSSPINVDVKADRIERLLVNVASYGRERMPFGGRLVVELATVELDRQFIDKYPNVRRGRHVLLTITEVRKARRLDGPLGLRGEMVDPAAAEAASDKPGVDLGALQGLIRDSGGHLWMEVQPSGDMVVKIHLPLRVADDSTGQRSSAKRTGLGRAMGRWRHH